MLFDQIKMQVQDKTTITGFPSLALKEITLVDNILTAKGVFDITKGEFIFENDKKIKANISYNFIASQNEGKIVAEGKLNAPDLAGQFGPDITFTAQPQGKARIVYYDGLIEAQARLNIQDTKINLKPDTQILGDPVAELSLIINPQGEKDAQFSYLGAISLAEGQALNLPYVKTAENISGNISFNPDKIIINSLSGVVNQAPMTLSGSIENFKNPLVAISLSANNVDLAAWKPFLNQYFKHGDMDAKGTASLKLKYKGKSGKLAGSLVNCSLSLKDAAFKGAFLKDGFFNISGECFYAAQHFDASYFLPDKATWNNLRLTYQDKDYVLNGSLQYNNLSTNINQGDLSLAAEAKIFPDRINILNLTGQYKNSQISSQGEIVYPRNKENMKINIKATTPGLYLEDLPEIIPALKEKLKDASLKGLCKGNILFAGDPTQWRDWALVISLSSDEVSLYNYKMNKVLLKYAQRDRFINECALSSIFYDGTIALQGSSDLSTNEMPYKLNVDIKNVDFSKLKDDSPFKDKDLAGFVSGTYTGIGPLSNLRLSQGNGNLSIKNGKLWHFDVLDGLAKLLFVPEKQNIALDSAEGNFSVLNQKVIIKDGLVRGNQVELSCNGNITFNGDLDLDIVARFGEGIIKSSQSLQKTIAALLSRGEDFLTVKVTGTIKETKYIPKGMNVIQKTKELILDALPNIFQ
ncbi:MAG: DUF748 domain-containing protein [Candidatus Omnitrophica bacterium]|nr:DUF748 domain-containing protein [Candidatus Omnitrophota bacterium]